MHTYDFKNALLAAQSYKLKARHGFTLIEILIAIGILVIIAGIGGLYLNDLYGAKRIENTADQITALLVTAQEKATSQEDNRRWGVYFDRPIGGTQTYTLYQVDELTVTDTPPFSPDRITRQVPLPGGVVFQNITGGSQLNIVFSKMTGLPVTIPGPTTYPIEIILDSADPGSSAITIQLSANGRIE